jgi:hypothetical protein
VGLARAAGAGIFARQAGPAAWRAVSLDWPYDLDDAHLFVYQERKLVQLAEQLGLPHAYQTSMDLAAYPRCSEAWGRLAVSMACPRVPACMITERCHHASQP